MSSTVSSPLPSGSGPAFVVGDSAGGGLALSLMVRLRQLGERSPRGAVLLSPWVNLSDAAVIGSHRDLWFSQEHLRGWARYYVGAADPRDPLLSPAYADLSGLALSGLPGTVHTMRAWAQKRAPDAA